MVTLTPRLFNTRPMDAAATPFPTLDTTPPVQKIYLGMGFSYKHQYPPPSCRGRGGEGHFTGDSPHRRLRRFSCAVMPVLASCSLDQFFQIAGRAAHIQHDQAQ